MARAGAHGFGTFRHRIGGRSEKIAKTAAMCHRRDTAGDIMKLKPSRQRPGEEREEHTMGYYSNLAIDTGKARRDESYPSPEQQLRWRLEDLQDRLEELTLGRATGGGRCLTESDLRYTPPEWLYSVYAVQKAIALAEKDLKRGLVAPAESDADQLTIIACRVRPCRERAA